jgi:redox-sensitive bicupin YhaK (pirin superfamily)
MTHKSRTLSNPRGRRAVIYAYTGGATVDAALISGAQGIILDREGQTYIVFCPTVNQVLTFHKEQVDVIWRDVEVRNLMRYHRKHQKDNLYNSSQ